MKILALSDTHNLHHKLTLPKADVIVHSGDFTNRGKEVELQNFAKWWNDLDYKCKVIIAGNHELGLETRPELGYSLLDGYLFEETVEIEGVKFFGSPWTPVFYDWAFMLNKPDLPKVWSKIPEDTDVLVTHGPPFGIGDLNRDNIRCGDEALLNRILEVKPKLHICGHIHDDYGARRNKDTVFANVACYDKLTYGKPETVPMLIDYVDGAVNHNWYWPRLESE